MSNRLQHFLFLLLVVFFLPQVVAGQYFYEDMSDFRPVKRRTKPKVLDRFMNAPAGTSLLQTQN